MVLLTQLPPELIHNILTFVDPEDLATVPRTCRSLYNFVSKNGTLCRDIFTRVLDPPTASDIDWEQELHDLVQLKRICASSSPSKGSDLPFVHKTALRLLSNASSSTARLTRSQTYPSSLNTALLTDLFSHESNRTAFLQRSFLFERARGVTTRFKEPEEPIEVHQMSAKLHSLYGMPVLKRGRTRSSSMYPFACSKVYDLREYTDETMWGPFMADGSQRADWEKVEAILLVLRANIKRKGLDGLGVFGTVWNSPFPGTWPGSYCPWPATGNGREKSDLDKEDPYDVTGTYLRVVCFLDYNDFFTYNFPLGDELPPHVPRPALDVGEATRVILMKINVTKIEWPEGRESGDGYPITHFRGFSRSLDGSWDENANSDLRVMWGVKGTAQMTPEGEVRWTTYSIFSGQERWKSEGIQLGGVRSARGVVGNWFDRDFDPHGPCGPTAFWKVSDRGPKNDDNRILLQDFLPFDGQIEDFDDPDFSTLGLDVIMPEYLQFGIVGDDEEDGDEDEG
ncbi:hypothetical protein OQA88_2806 [Cercophora sp. LCS_1]